MSYRGAVQRGVSCLGCSGVNALLILGWINRPIIRNPSESNWNTHSPTEAWKPEQILITG
ncbi:hypothetical protein J6590_055421 [Homalodisca vitripennis]|nr:hypothetical protein J6590_055421 [Homalodisca vitripennis]